MHDDRLRHVEVIPVRLEDVGSSYSTLREMDGRDDSPRANKYIVLDLSSDAALRRILKQVRALDNPFYGGAACPIIRSFSGPGPAGDAPRAQISNRSLVGLSRRLLNADKSPSRRQATGCSAVPPRSMASSWHIRPANYTVSQKVSEHYRL